MTPYPAYPNSPPAGFKSRRVAERSPRATGALAARGVSHRDFSRRPDVDQARDGAGPIEGDVATRFVRLYVSRGGVKGGINLSKLEVTGRPVAGALGHYGSGRRRPRIGMAFVL